MNNTALIWFVLRSSDGELARYEQQLTLEDGDVISEWERNVPVTMSEMTDAIASGIDSSLDDHQWSGNVVAAGWVFGREPDWHRTHRESL